MKQRVTLDLPAEFLELCERDRVPPEQVLRTFIADLCGIQNYVSAPRADGYCSSGSDERHLAYSYYERVGYSYMREMDDEARAKAAQPPKPGGKGPQP